MIGKILAGASWITLVIGLLWTGKLRIAAAEPGPPFETESLALEESASVVLDAAASGEAEFALVVESPDQHDTDAFAAWLDTRTGPLRCEIDVRGGGKPLAWTIDGDDMRIADSVYLDDRMALLVLATRRVPVTEGVSYTVTARVATDDEFFLEHRPTLLTGRLHETPVRLPVRDKRPGLVLLAGAAGVFIHLFGIWIRFMVPWREPLPPEELEIPATA